MPTETSTLGNRSWSPLLRTASIAATMYSYCTCGSALTVTVSSSLNCYLIFSTQVVRPGQS
jgi:hypothetical protein